MNDKKLLIVDDNESYKELLEKLYIEKGYTKDNIDWVKSAAQGKAILQQKGTDYYAAIVTDITMESQTSGLFFALKLHKHGFHGEITIASTGFDFRVVLILFRRLLGIKGIDFVIPKASLIKGKPQILSCK